MVAIVGQQKRISQGAHYQQEVALDNLFADVSEFCQVVMHPAQVRHVIDRAFKTALSRRGVSTIIIPDDIQEEEAQPSPPKMHGAVYSSVGWSNARVLPDEVELASAAEILNEGSKVAILVGQGAAGAEAEVIEAAELLGLRGIYCDDPGQVGKAWDEALGSDVPVILEFRTDPEVPPLPPHIMKDQARKSVKAALHDPDRMGLAARGFRQKLAEYYEKLPGRDT